MSQPRRLHQYSPVPSLAAANQSQIEDLVQRNKTLDATQKKLIEESKQERERQKAELLRLKEEQGRVEEEWRKSCYDMLGMCRISQKKVQLELEAERTRVIQEMRICREEKLERMKRDYKIKLFQMRDEELEQQIMQLEEEKRALVVEHEEETEQLRDELDELRSRLKDALDETKRAKKNKDVLQTKFDKLTEEFATHHASSSTMSTKLERLKLQLEGAQNKNTDLERTNDELTRTNTQLKRQIDDWQNLEKREGEEMDSERKRRVALSVELNKLEAQHKSDTDKFEMALDKERQKVEKWKEAIGTWQATAKETEAELHDSEKKANKLQKQVDKLKADLEVERARVRPPSPVKAISTTNHIDEPEQDSDILKRKASTSKPASKQKARGKSRADASDAEYDEPPKTKPAKPPRKPAGKTKEKRAEPSDDEDVEEIAMPEDPESAEEDEEEEEVTEVTKPAPITKRRGKQVSAPPEGVEEPAPPKKRGRPPKEKKPVQKRVSTAVSADKDDLDEPQAAKKKRKINHFKIFPNNPAPFDFEAINFGGAGGLDIPSMLSPVRDGDPVPPRSDHLSRRSGLR